MTHTRPYVGQVCWTGLSQPGGLVEILWLTHDSLYCHVAQIRHVLAHPYGYAQGTVGWYPVADLLPCAWPEEEHLTLDLDPDVRADQVPGVEEDAVRALLVQQQAAFPGVQARAQSLYAAYVAGLGPLGEALPPWQDLIDRQQYAWRCVAREQGEGHA